MKNETVSHTFKIKPCLFLGHRLHSNLGKKTTHMKRALQRETTLPNRISELEFPR